MAGGAGRVRAEPRRARVHQRAAARWQRDIDGVRDQRLGEPEYAARREQLALAQRVGRRGRGVAVEPGQARGVAQLDRRPEQGDGFGERAGIGRQGLHAPGDEALEPTRGVPAAAGLERREVLPEQEGVAAGRCLAGVHALRARLAPEPGPQHGRDRGPAERPRPQHGRAAVLELPQSARLTGTPARQEGDAHAREPQRGERQPLLRCLVGPVRVVDGEQQRRPSGQGDQRRVEGEQCGVVTGAGENQRAHPPAELRFKRLVGDAEGQLAFVLDAACGQTGEPARGGALARVVEQRCAPDPGGPDDDQRATGPAVRALEQIVDRRELVPAVVQRSPHGPTVDPRPARRIGRTPDLVRRDDPRGSGCA